MFGDFGGCSPYIDGELIVAKEHKRLADSAQMKIPYMIGSTSEDVVPPPSSILWQRPDKSQITAFM